MDTSEILVAFAMVGESESDFEFESDRIPHRKSAFCDPILSIPTGLTFLLLLAIVVYLFVGRYHCRLGLRECSQSIQLLDSQLQFRMVALLILKVARPNSP